MTDAPAVSEIAPDADVELGLGASVKIFDFCKEKINLLNGAETLTISKGELKMLKKNAVNMNKSIARFAKRSHATEDRLILEQHLLRQIMSREATDRDANRARVYELLRTHQHNGATSSSNAALSQNSNYNALLAPSAAQLTVDRALSSVARIEAALLALSPTGTVSIHGAGCVSTHNLREAHLASMLGPNV